MQIISAQDAAALVENGWTVTTGGFGSCGHPEAFSSALKQRFLDTGAPQNLTLVFAAGQGDRQRMGLNKLAHTGLLKRVIGGYWALAPKLGQLASDTLIEAYNWPQGVISHLFRAIAAGAPGVTTRIGLDTFIDPRQTGGRLNACTTEEMVKLVKLGRSNYLFYPTFPIDCAVIRATRADAKGNLSFEEEANLPEVLAQAQAAHNSGGVVIAQVKEIVPAGTIELQKIRVPGMLIDYVFQARESEHWQTYGHPMNPAFLGQGPRADIYDEALVLDARTVIARRAYLEILKLENPIVNLGIGTPERIARVAAAEDGPPFVLTVESGAIGGTPVGGLSFGASIHPEAMLDQPALFDFYDGGGLDISFLGFGQIDSTGNVNVGRLGERINGIGGFVNISQSVSRLVFCGSFSAGEQEVWVRDNRLHIVRDGLTTKFVRSVKQIDFYAAGAYRHGVDVKYVTERAVSELRADGVYLTEVAPGVDAEHDILMRCQSRVSCAEQIHEMNPQIFQEQSMLTRICRKSA
jgi:propionate CoA-transferase